MELSYWISRWKRGKIGFHMEGGYPGLRKNWNRLNLDSDPVILIPLAGKSQDILWLSEKAKRVVAVEISELAIHQFIEENGLKARIEDIGGYKNYIIDNITFLCVDFMSISKNNLPRFNLIFDKGSIVALPPEKRIAYAEKLISLCTIETMILMHLISYPGQTMPGPPFSVTTEDVKQYFGNLYQIHQLDCTEVALSDYEKFRQRGLKSNFFEILLLLSRKQSI